VRLARLIRALGVKLLLMLDRGANLLFLKTTVDTAYLAPEALPIQVALSSPKLARNGNALLPLIDPITSATAYFGGIRISMWTWSCTICPSTMVLPRCPANSRNTGPRNFRILPYKAFFRPFG